MVDLQDFVGTWHTEPGAPFSTHVFTWTAAGDTLRGEWIIEAARPTERFPHLPEGPKRIQMPIGEPSLDANRLLFSMNGSPFPSEFRLVGENEAVLGAAADRLPPEFSGPEHRRSIEGHRVRLQRVGTQA